MIQVTNKMDKEKFNEIMKTLSQEYFAYLGMKDQAEAGIERLRIAMETALRSANEDGYDVPDSPVVVTYKMKKKPERMKRGAKDMLRNILTPSQWKAIYEEPGEAPSLLVKRRKE